MRNTASIESVEPHGLSTYEIEQPIAALLGNFVNTILYPSSGYGKPSGKKDIEIIARNATDQIEYWSTSLSFLIWKVSSSGDICKQTTSCIGDCAGMLGTFASMFRPLNDLRCIEELEEKGRALGIVLAKNTEDNTTSNSTTETKDEVLTMLGDLEAMSATSMHRVMDGLENGNPVPADTLIGLFSGITRNTSAIREMVENIYINK